MKTVTIIYETNVQNKAFKENETSNGAISKIEQFLNNKGYKTVKNIGYSEYKIG